jgi:serine/threonine protein kinase/Tol biopolymer transport system component
MTPERWQEVKKVLAAALERRPAERRAYLDQSCSDSSVRSEVESLIVAHEQGHDSFLERPPTAGIEVLEGGTRLGPYEIRARIGEGGMGVVYRAHDTRLERTVAVKVLPVGLADRSDLRERFEREARAIGSLNHPHICTLYDIGEQGGTDYLVMEYLEGETLAQRLLRGPLPLNQVMQYAIEISDALDKAHRKGVTHRDLKPGNIMLTKSGAKLLDFGLAKLRQHVAPANVQVSQGPRMSHPLTAQGTIVGTLQYMAPEQLEGKEIDGRTDIFSFGGMVYEMATGKKAFEGDSQASVIAKILEIDPPPISSLQPLTPPALDRVIGRCLAKESDERWQSANDLANELKWIAEGGSQLGLPHITPAKGNRTGWRAVLPWIVAALSIAVAVLVYQRASHAPATDQLLRFQFFPPEKTKFGTGFALSPDGRHLAFTATAEDGRTRLWVRDLDSLEARLLPGTEDAAVPFWSPDSRVLGFATGTKLERVDISGGAPQTICDVSIASYGGSWNRDGVIVFGSYAGLMKVSAAGGTPSLLTKVDASRGEFVHGNPSFLQDGRHFLYVRLPGAAAGTYVGSIDAEPEQQSSNRLFAESGRYVPTSGPGRGHILFVQNGTLMAQTFDAARLEFKGDPEPIARQVAGATVSGNDILAYSGANTALQLTWFDRQGKVLGTLGEPGVVQWPAISPDGSAVAVPRVAGAGVDLWLYNLARGTQSRLTFDGKTNEDPLWSPDGSHIAYVSYYEGGVEISQKPVNGIGQDEVLDKTPANQRVPLDWSHDGRYIIEGVLLDSKAKASIWVLPAFSEHAGDDRKAFPYVNDQFNEFAAKLSPNGQWLAYGSDETGRYEVYVQTFPKLGGKWPVSVNGGTRPAWSSDGKELYFIGLDGKLMASEVNGGPGGGFEAGAPKPLFDSHIGGDQFTSFAVAQDGRFLIPTAVSQSGAPITVVVDWAARLEK